ncbi:hypothetical protein [Kitasatospora sp. NPDC056184]|uniref:hypothetical protein n=1 Tax=Kitasatospora sp. NPDC056184 TaxID=3345738 RepID=UPI0035DDC9F3
MACEGIEHTVVLGPPEVLRLERLSGTSPSSSLFLGNELAERWGCRPRAGGVGKFV